MNGTHVVFNLLGVKGGSAKMYIKLLKKMFFIYVGYSRKVVGLYTRLGPPRYLFTVYT